MSIRLQLENGEIKEYCTWYPIYSGGEDSTPKGYRTKCGVLWDKEPHKSDGCNHIDCALKAQGGGIISGIILAVFLIGFAIAGLDICFREAGGYFWVVMLIPAIASIAFSASILSYGWKSEKIKHELYEFRKYGTINGINARLIN
jgi:hypothetical protein